MKLLKAGACHSAPDRGNVKGMTVMGDVAVDWFSDRGSIPLSSISIGQKNELRTDDCGEAFVFCGFCGFYLKGTYKRNKEPLSKALYCNTQCYC